ncbi:MAG: lytic transglycosylase domain-containing protein [Acidobacteriota bacterium]
MPHVSARFVTLVVVGALSLSAADARADIVKLTNGRTMRVDSARFEGSVVILLMHGGGEIRAPKDLVEEFLPEDMPWARDAAREALAASPTAAAPRLAAGVIRGMVEQAARRTSLDVKLAQAVVRVESNYEPLAISHRGAMGLMQIMPTVARTYAVRDPYDPRQNLEAGMKHLVALLKRFRGDVRRALAAYNAGEGAVSRYGGVPPYRETQMYVSRIMASIR